MIIYLVFLATVSSAVHTPATDGEDRYDTVIEPDNELRSLLEGMDLYNHLSHLSDCDVDLTLLKLYSQMSLEAFESAWFRTDFHFEYRMNYLDSLLLMTDALG